MENVTETFRFSSEAWRYLQAEGIRVELRTFLNHVKRERMPRNEAGRLLKEGVLAYALATWRKGSGEGNLSDLLNLKTAREIELLDEKIRALRDERLIREGRYILKEETGENGKF
jgi:hypothetical protein